MRKSRKLVLRLALFASLIVLALVLLLPIYAGSRYESARREFEERIGPLRFETFTLGQVPEEENAADWILEATRVLNLETADLTALKRLIRMPVAEWSEEDRAAAEDVADSNADALRLLDRARTCPQATYRIDYEAGVNAQIPPLIEILKTARLALLDAKIGAADGDPGRLQRGFEILETTTASLTAESTLITTIVSLAAYHLLLEAIQEMLHPDVEIAQLRTAVDRIERLDPSNAMHRSIHGEATLAVSLPPDAAHGGPAPGAIKAVALRYTENLSRAAMLDSYRRLIESLDTPWNQIELAHEQGALKPGFWAARSPLWVNLVDVVSRLKAVESSRELALAALRLRIRALEDGRYPPTHPFRSVDPYSGKPFEYDPGDRGSDGGKSVTVSAPASADRWLQRHGTLPERRRPRFTYRLPAAGTDAGSR